MQRETRIKQHVDSIKKTVPILTHPTHIGDRPYTWHHRKHDRYNMHHKKRKTYKHQRGISKPSQHTNYNNAITKNPFFVTIITKG